MSGILSMIIPKTPSKTDPDEYGTDEDQISDSEQGSDVETGSSGSNDISDVENPPPLSLPPDTPKTPDEPSDLSDKDETDEKDEDEEEPSHTKCDELDTLIKGIQENISKEFQDMNDKLREERRKLPDITDLNLGSNGSEVSTTSTPRSIGQDSIVTELFDTLGKKKRRFDKIVYDEDREPFHLEETEGKEDTEDTKGWSKHKKHRLRFCLWRLKYNRIVTQFYLNDLKKSEEYWSWLIILISTLTSAITVANNVDEEPIPNYRITIKIMLNVSSMTTALIAAWIKKKKFVEKINEIDKYLIGINKLCEELEIQMTLLEGDRITYKEFKDKYIPQIIHFASTNPIIPPDIWKKCVRDITVNYPELVDPDSSEVNKMWPWFGDLIEHKEGDNVYHIRKSTNFMKYMKKTNTDKIRSSCCRKKRDCENVYK
jgi:hypothetical protein